MPFKQKGMKVPPHDALFFGAVESELNDYFRAHAGGALLNYSQDPLYAAFAPGQGGVPPFYMHWGELAKLYPDHQQRLSAPRPVRRGRSRDEICAR